MKFAELNSLSDERLAEIRRKGCVVIRDVVDDEEARTWQAWLREYVSKNPQVHGKDSCDVFVSAKCVFSQPISGMPENDKQFFQL